MSKVTEKQYSHFKLLLFFFIITLFTAAVVHVQGVGAVSRTPFPISSLEKMKVQRTSSANQATIFENSGGEGKITIMEKRKRLMIGSVAPTCTYNECRGCKYKCRAEQVPVEGNDPINSAYHYKCVCHR